MSRESGKYRWFCALTPAFPTPYANKFAALGQEVQARARTFHEINASKAFVRGGVDDILELAKLGHEHNLPADRGQAKLGHMGWQLTRAIAWAKQGQTIGMHPEAPRQTDAQARMGADMDHTGSCIQRGMFARPYMQTCTERGTEDLHVHAHNHLQTNTTLYMHARKDSHTCIQTHAYHIRSSARTRHACSHAPTQVCTPS